MTIKIQLTQNHQTVIDDIDADLVSYRWVAMTYGNVVYATRAGKRIGERRLNKKEPHIRLHRVILSRILGRDLSRVEMVDHIDGDGLNNTRGNLRLATSSQNNMNARIRKDNKTGYKGVTIGGRKKDRFVAHIRVDGRVVHLGTFSTAEQAHEAYKSAALKHFGEFARFE